MLSKFVNNMELKFLHRWVFTSERFGISFKDLVKETLQQLQVPYTDVCCDQSYIPPMASPSPFSKKEISEEEINLAAIKSLYEEIQKLKEEIAELKKAQNN